MSTYPFSELARVVPPDRLTSDPAELTVYGYDGTWLERRPDAAVSVVSADEVAGVLRWANRNQVPVVPRGAGSGLAGGSVPISGGVVLNMTLMTCIKDINRRTMRAVVEPGVVNADLQAAVERHGLFYPPDPASLRQSTIGGNVATGASGPRCLKYGGTREYVVGLEVVIPTGEIIHTDASSGDPSDLTRLFIGSEGTLGVITDITLRLISKPPARGTVMATFCTLEQASAAVDAVLSAGVEPLALEMMDQPTLRCVELHLKSGLPLDVAAMLLIEVDGNDDSVSDQMGVVIEQCRKSEAVEIRPAGDETEAQALWKIRRSTSSSFGRMYPNKLGEDISVPRSAIPEMVRRIQRIAEEYNLDIPLFGHIGDGNLHPNVLCDLRDSAQMERVVQAAQAIFLSAIELGGTLSGEHGIGLLKREFVRQSLDPVLVDLMEMIKDSLDPNNILNPGKVLSNPQSESG